MSSISDLLFSNPSVMAEWSNSIGFTLREALGCKTASIDYPNRQIGNLRVYRNKAEILFEYGYCEFFPVPVRFGEIREFMRGLAFRGLAGPFG